MILQVNVEEFKPEEACRQTWYITSVEIPDKESLLRLVS
jgi:hypothetical protein